MELELKAQTTLNGIKMIDSKTLAVPLEVQRVIIRGAVMGEVYKRENHIKDSLLLSKDTALQNRNKTIEDQNIIISAKDQQSENKDVIIKIEEKEIKNKKLKAIGKSIETAFKKVVIYPVIFAFGAIVGVLVNNKYEITK